MDLDQVLTLRRAYRYAHAQNPLSVLPRSFGNFLDPDVVDPNPLGGGFTPCVCIDTDNLVYLVNDGPAVTTPPQIFANGKIQDPSVAVWYPANNYEGQGIIAGLQFRLRVVLDYEISVRFGGSVDGSGVPITNPVSMIFDMLTRYAGWTEADFDRGTCERTAQDMDILQYPAFFCFQETDKTVREWLMELLPTYHTDFVETGSGQLAIILDRSLTVFQVFPDYHIPAYEIEDNGSPSTAITFEAQADDVANQITLHGRQNWATNDNTTSYTWDYLQSQSAYQAAYPIEFTFRGMYTSLHAIQWLQSFAMRHGFEPRTATLTMKGLKGIPLISPRIVTVEWPYPPYNWVQHLLKIRKTAISPDGRNVTLECVDCQRELSDTITSPQANPTQRRRQVSRLYSWVPETVGAGGNLLDAPADPRNEAANGYFELGDNGQWDFYAGNAAQQWVIVDDLAGAYQGRRYAVSVPNAGTGEARTLRTRIDEGEWLVVSGWFAQHVAGTNGQAVAGARFYDQDDHLLSTIVGNFVFPLVTYSESVAVGQAPANAYYYRPGIGFLGYPTVGQWRADKVVAKSGSLAEVLASRQDSPTTQNAIVNGNFESGPIMFLTTGGWDITNSPTVVARSGLWKAFHNANTVRFQVDRLSSLTEVSVIPGLTLTMQVWVMTIGTLLSGTARLGLDWIDGQGGFISSEASPSNPGPFPTYTLATASVVVPAGVVRAHIWIETQDATGPGSGWAIDDLSVTFQ